jgi:hypothetical protein
MGEFNGHNPVELVAGDDEDFPGQTPDPFASHVIYIHAQFIGGNTEVPRVRDISVSIPVRAGDTFSDYAVAIEAAVRELGALGYQYGYQPPKISVARGDQ